MIIFSRWYTLFWNVLPNIIQYSEGKSEEPDFEL